MKKIYFFLSTFVTSGLLFAGNITWTGATSSNWNDPSNWSAGVPLVTDDVIFNNAGAPHMPILDMPRTVSSISFSAGTLDLGGLTLSVNGTTKANIFSGGTISHGIIDLSNTASTVNFTGTTFNATVNANVGRATFSNSTFNNPVVLKKNASGTDTSPGGNTFNSTLEVTVAIGSFYMSNTSADTYTSTVSITNEGTGTVNFSRGAVSSFNSNVEVNSSSTGTIALGNTTNTVGPIFNGNLIQGVAKVNSGTIQVNYAKIYNPWNVTFDPSGTGILRFTQTVVANAFTYDGPGFISEATNYDNPVIIKRRGGASDVGGGNNVFNSSVDITSFSTAWSFSSGSGGNTYNGLVTFTNMGTGEVRITNNTTSPTTFNDNATFVNNSTGRIVLALNGTNQVDFHGDLSLSNSSTGYIRGATSATSTIHVYGDLNVDASAGSISTASNGAMTLDGNINVGTFENASLNLTKLTQTSSVTPINLNLTNNSILSILNSSWAGMFTASTPVFRTQTSTYQSITSITQTGSAIGYSYGGNTFNDDVVWTNTGTSTLLTANTMPDIFKANVTVNYTSGGTLFAYRGSSIAGNLTLNTATTPTIARYADLAFNGNSSQSISLTGGATQVLAYYIAINAKTGGQLDLQTNLSIANSLNFGDNFLSLNGKNLLITNTSGTALSFGNGGIICEDPTQTSVVTWTIGTNTDNHIIPFRNSSGELVAVEGQGLGTSVGLFTATTYGTNNQNQPFPPAVNALLNNSGRNNSNKTMDRFFHIKKSGGGSMNIAFHYGASEMTGTNTMIAANLQAQRWNTVSSRWETPVGTVDLGDKKVVINGLSTFSDWVLVDNSSPLPVVMQSFTATPHGKTVVLEWLTGIEKNNDRFEVEKSTDAVLYTMTGMVKGTNKDNSSYNFTDNTPTIGTNYYRLKQVDIDGYYNYSEVKAINFTDDGFISVYPTQTSDELYFNFNGKKGLTTIEIVDLSGRTVYKEVFDCENYPIKTISCKTWGNGLYVAKVRNGQSNFTTKIVVQ